MDIFNKAIRIVAVCSVHLYLHTWYEMCYCPSPKEVEKKDLPLRYCHLFSTCNFPKSPLVCLVLIAKCFVLTTFLVVILEF